MHPVGIPNGVFIRFALILLYFLCGIEAPGDPGGVGSNPKSQISGLKDEVKDMTTVNLRAVACLS